MSDALDPRHTGEKPPRNRLLTNANKHCVWIVRTGRNVEIFGAGEKPYLSTRAGYYASTYRYETWHREFRSRPEWRQRRGPDGRKRACEARRSWCYTGWRAGGGPELPKDVALLLKVSI